MPLTCIAAQHGVGERTLRRWLAAYRPDGLAGLGPAAAIAALRQLRPGISIRRFSLAEEEPEEIGVKGPCGYLVRADDGGLARLGHCVESVRGARGYLAVLAEHESAHGQAAVLPSMSVEPPSPLLVYQRRAALRGLTEWQHWDEARMLLRDALPGDARRLAELVEQIGARGGDLATLGAEVAHAYRGWAEELRAWFSGHQQPHERALLVAAVTLSPAPEEAVVYSAASSLARRLEITVNGGGLAWCPVTSLSELLEAEREGDRIVFRRHGFAGSALRHAMADYPLARTDLLSWLAGLPTEDAVPYPLRNPLAATFADLAAEHGTAAHITETARKWTGAGLADPAFLALSRTCLHPRVGGAVRKALYDWSRAPGIPQTLKLTIARVCEPLGQAYLSVALTRLKHLATHGNRQVRGQVVSAAHALAESGDRTQVLTAALAWCTDSSTGRLPDAAQQRRRRTGAALFLELASPLTQAACRRSWTVSEPSTR